MGEGDIIHSRPSIEYAPAACIRLSFAVLYIFIPFTRPFFLSIKTVKLYIRYRHPRGVFPDTSHHHHYHHRRHPRTFSISFDAIFISRAKSAKIFLVLVHHARARAHQRQSRHRHRLPFHSTSLTTTCANLLVRKRRVKRLSPTFASFSADRKVVACRWLFSRFRIPGVVRIIIIFVVVNFVAFRNIYY